MFVIIQAHEYQKYAAVLEQMFRLRKKVFADTLGWDGPVICPDERDSYDSLAPAYLVCCNDSRTRLYGGMRRMPT
ncbi:acyl-homoserine-lactone synthase, partial [Rhizobium johnstonii]|uniref:acyl-homoserine-lactone synthase n=1 Tax=Rhizobium johnstonii TaxID=3019933 RepID=UPI003F9BD302